MKDSQQGETYGGNCRIVSNSDRNMPWIKAMGPDWAL